MDAYEPRVYEASASSISLPGRSEQLLGLPKVGSGTRLPVPLPILRIFQRSNYAQASD